MAKAGVRRIVLKSLAHLIHQSRVVDLAFKLFDRARSKVVLRIAPDDFFDLFNDFSHARQEQYRGGTKSFRQHLFSWERRLFEQYLPPPPCAVLLGAAGGGRESLALVSAGYRVVAFEPVRVLAESMADAAPDSTGLEVLLGRYQDLPVVQDFAGRPVDLRQRNPFDAAILGWGSFSYLRSDAQRAAVLRTVADLTPGPILLSFFALPADGGTTTFFSPVAGYVHWFTSSAIRDLATRAGLDVVAIDDEYWGTAVLKRAPSH